MSLSWNIMVSMYFPFAKKLLLIYSHKTIFLDLNYSPSKRLSDKASRAKKKLKTKLKITNLFILINLLHVM